MTHVTIETSGQVGVRSAVVRAKVKVRARRNINFRSLNSSISVLFFFNRPKISRGIHFFALECPEMKCKGRTAHTRVSRTVRMNKGRVVAHSRQYKQEIDPF